MVTEQAEAVVYWTFGRRVDGGAGETVNRNECFWEGHLQMGGEITG